MEVRMGKLGWCTFMKVDAEQEEGLGRLLWAASSRNSVRRFNIAITKKGIPTTPLLQVYQHY